jgi:nucleoside-diphosphate-sugar epimerase
VSIRAIVTGGAGFIGTLLARRLLAGPLSVGGADPADVAELFLVDLVVPPPDLAADPRVRAVTGDLATVLAGLSGGDADVIFHLAGVVSGAAEADFDLGMRVNVDGTRAVLEFARRQRKPPVLVFSSSLAVFGAEPPAGWPAGPAGVVGDDTLPCPQSSYGIQKFVGEQFVADYTRKGFTRGRSVRLMTVAVRPGKPNAAASSFVSGIIREPLAGLRAPCPVPPDTPVALSSPRKTLEGILRAAAVRDADWGSRTAMNLPGLTTTPRDMATAMDRVAGYPASQLIDWTDDPVIGAIVHTWPARVETRRAHALGLRPDGSFDDIVREYLTDNRPLGYPALRRGQARHRCQDAAGLTVTLTPFSRTAAPIVAVAWITALAFGASDGGVTVNDAATA